MRWGWLLLVGLLLAGCFSIPVSVTAGDWFRCTEQRSHDRQWIQACS